MCLYRKLSHLSKCSLVINLFFLSLLLQQWLEVIERKKERNEERHFLFRFFFLLFLFTLRT